MIAFLDTSAYAKLVLAEDGTAVVREVWAAADHLVVSSFLYVEMRATLAAALRARRLDDLAYERVLGDFEANYERCARVPLGVPLIRRAGEVAARYALRAADAVQLASALAVMDTETVFVTWDKRLHSAAIQAGMHAVPAALE